MLVGALIPCRKGSKGIPGKNFKQFNGKPLVEWTIDVAQKSNLFSKIIVSSDGGARNIVLREGDVDVLDNQRARQFSTDDARLDPLLWHYAEQYPEIELWCLLQPTSPLRSVNDLKESYKLIKGSKYDSVVSVKSDPGFLWIDNAVGHKGETKCIATYHLHKRPNRQDRQDWYKENGAIYWAKRYVLESLHCRLGGNIGLYVMPEDRSLEIDTPLDWFIAERVGEQWAG
jgi:N-acylneuraminate cytidylyltransferase